jgi:hypothetical protein
MKESNTENRTKEKRAEAEKGGALAERPPFSLERVLLVWWVVDPREKFVILPVPPARLAVGRAVGPKRTSRLEPRVDRDLF